MTREISMPLTTDERQVLIQETLQSLLARAAGGTLDTADPLRGFRDLHPAWRDPDESWALAAGLLRASEVSRLDAEASPRHRSHANVVYGLALNLYDEARLRHLSTARSDRPGRVVATNQL